MDKMNPTVSVIVTSYTMARFNDLSELLDSLHAQIYRDFEIVLVMERSTELYEKLKTHVQEGGWQNTKLLFNHGSWGLSQARNL